MATYSGSCHCGDIQFEIVSDLRNPGVCNCSYCVRRGTIGLYVALEDFTLKSGGESLGEYRFRTRTAAHYFCRRCGISVFGHYSWKGQERYGVNLGCLEGVDVYALEPRLNDGRAYK